VATWEGSHKRKRKGGSREHNNEESGRYISTALLGLGQQEKFGLREKWRKKQKDGEDASQFQLGNRCRKKNVFELLWGNQHRRFAIMPERSIQALKVRRRGARLSRRSSKSVLIYGKEKRRSGPFVSKRRLRRRNGRTDNRKRTRRKTHRRNGELQCREERCSPVHAKGISRGGRLRKEKSTGGRRFLG